MRWIPSTMALKKGEKPQQETRHFLTLFPTPTVQLLISFLHNPDAISPSNATGILV